MVLVLGNGAAETSWRTWWQTSRTVVYLRAPCCSVGLTVQTAEPFPSGKAVAIVAYVIWDPTVFCYAGMDVRSFSRRHYHVKKLKCKAYT